jgi:hypothetical protein
MPPHYKSLDLPTVLDQRVLSWARYHGADAALADLPAAISEEEAHDVLNNELRFDPPALSSCCDADPNIYTLTDDIIDLDVLVRARVGEWDAIEAALTAAWEEGRDAVWNEAIQAVALRILGKIDQALAIERSNEDYIDSRRVLQKDA